MKQTQPLPQSSTDTSKTPEGNLLKVMPDNQGHHIVTLDNGPTTVMRIMTNSYQLGDLLGSDLAEIRAHLMSRKPGHFRRKQAS